MANQNQTEEKKNIPPRTRTSSVTANEVTRKRPCYDCGKERSRNAKRCIYCHKKHRKRNSIQFIKGTTCYDCNGDKSPGDERCQKCDSQHIEKRASITSQQEE